MLVEPQFELMSANDNLEKTLSQDAGVPRQWRPPGLADRPKEQAS
jgi:hypothetical protein